MRFGSKELSISREQSVLVESKNLSFLYDVVATWLTGKNPQKEVTENTFTTYRYYKNSELFRGYKIQTESGAIRFVLDQNTDKFTLVPVSGGEEFLWEKMLSYYFEECVSIHALDQYAIVREDLDQLANTVIGQKRSLIPSS
jgi:hypothetical protein